MHDYFAVDIWTFKNTSKFFPNLAAPVHPQLGRAGLPAERARLQVVPEDREVPLPVPRRERPPLRPQVLPRSSCRKLHWNGEFFLEGGE